MKPPRQTVSWVRLTNRVIALTIGTELVEHQPWIERLARHLHLPVPRFRPTRRRA